MERLAQLQWISFCTCLDTPKPCTQLWWMFHGLHSAPEQLHPFLRISLNRNLPEQVIADEFCTWLTEDAVQPIYGRSSCTRTSLCTFIDQPFTPNELSRALHAWNHKSIPGPDSTCYLALAHLGSTARGIWVSSTIRGRCESCHRAGRRLACFPCSREDGHLLLWHHIGLSVLEVVREKLWNAWFSRDRNSI